MRNADNSLDVVGKSRHSHGGLEDRRKTKIELSVKVARSSALSSSGPPVLHVSPVFPDSFLEAIGKERNSHGGPESRREKKIEVSVNIRGSAALSSSGPPVLHVSPVFPDSFLARRCRWALLFICLVAGGLHAGEPAAYVPKLGEFPPPDAGTYYAGELVSVDHVNRRGAIRLDGDGSDGKYHSAPSHRFALLPYGTIRYHGAPAELRDIPIGTHVHGRFVLPPAGDTTIAPPTREPQHVPKETHVITLEDDISFYQRQGQTWTITAVDLKKGTLAVTSSGTAATNGLRGAKTFELDLSTRIWKGRQFAKLSELAAQQVVQLNLTWAPEWKNGVFHIADVWIDQESRDVSAEQQRRLHVRHQHHRWLAGWIDHVEHLAGGHGIVTVTLFGGMDPSLYDEVRKHTGGFDIAAADVTLRSWWQDHDKKGGDRVELKELPNPPPGSSGIQIRVKCWALLEGYRPGRIVRVRPHSWPNSKLPPEERIQNADDR